MKKKPTQQQVDVALDILLKQGKVRIDISGRYVLVANPPPPALPN